MTNIYKKSRLKRINYLKLENNPDTIYHCENPDCNKQISISLSKNHHLIPVRLSKKLSLEPENMRLLCINCHNLIHNKLKEKKDKTKCNHCKKEMKIDRRNAIYRVGNRTYHYSCFYEAYSKNDVVYPINIKNKDLEIFINREKKYILKDPYEKSRNIAKESLAKIFLKIEFSIKTDKTCEFFRF